MILTDEEREDLFKAAPVSPTGWQDFAKAIESAVVAKLAGMDVEPVAYATNDGRVATVDTVTTAMPKASRDNFNIALYNTESLAAAAEQATKDLQAEIERLRGHIKHIGNDALRKENAALQAKLDAAAEQAIQKLVERSGVIPRVVAAVDVSSPSTGLLVMKPALDYYRASEVDGIIAALQAKLEAARQDAERYQWLTEYLFGPRTNTDIEDALMESQTVSEITAVIDAARKAQQ